MKALVYQGPGRKEWRDVPDAAIQEPTDAVVRVDTTTICGTDLHILQGDVAAVTEGRILGHEAVGTVTAVGDAVKGFSAGDRVLVPATRGLRRVQERRRELRPQGGDHSRLILACHKSSVSFGCCNDQN